MEDVKNYWENNPCIPASINSSYDLKTYFEEIEKIRYDREKEIIPFAQFPKYNRKRILEVGIGAGTDFMQWCKAGANASGIDLTKAAVELTRRRLNLFGFNQFELAVANAENLPYKDNTFDLVYSWGVIHHSPDFNKALEEILRVTKPGGSIKLMVYNRYSFTAYSLWIKNCLFRGKPFKNLNYVISNFMESKGTRSFSRKELLEILRGQKVKNLSVNTVVTFYDLKKNKIFIFYLLAFLTKIIPKSKTGWFHLIEFKK